MNRPVPRLEVTIVHEDGFQTAVAPLQSRDLLLDPTKFTERYVVPAGLLALNEIQRLRSRAAEKEQHQLRHHLRKWMKGLKREFQLNRRMRDAGQMPAADPNRLPR